MPAGPLLSIVIPAYNEALRLPETLTQLQAYAAQQSYQIEVLVVDDGSEDITAQIVEELAASWAVLRLLGLTHGGKGQAIRQGLLEARGELIFICDADLSMPIEQL